MFSTQFESCDARRAFPCFDEPNLKASFDFEIEIPEDQTALSNMPEKGTRKGAKEGWKVVSFEKAPVMSTYLYAWAFGDFEYVEDHTRRKYNGKNLPVRVYATKGLKEQGRWALSNCHQVVDYFSEVYLLKALEVSSRLTDIDIQNRLSVTKSRSSCLSRICNHKSILLLYWLLC
jgi:aminopeptidase N